jgi:hypothetical protein
MKGRVVGKGSGISLCLLNLLHCCACVMISWAGLIMDIIQNSKPLSIDVISRFYLPYTNPTNSDVTLRDSNARILIGI